VLTSVVWSDAKVDILLKYPKNILPPTVKTLIIKTINFKKYLRLPLSLTFFNDRGLNYIVFFHSITPIDSTLNTKTE